MGITLAILQVASRVFSMINYIFVLAAQLYWLLVPLEFSTEHHLVLIDWFQFNFFSCL